MPSEEERNQNIVSDDSIRIIKDTILAEINAIRKENEVVTQLDENADKFDVERKHAFNDELKFFKSLEAGTGKLGYEVDKLTNENNRLRQQLNEARNIRVSVERKGMIITSDLMFAIYEEMSEYPSAIFAIQDEAEKWAAFKGLIGFSVEPHIVSYHTKEIQ